MQTSIPKEMIPGSLLQYTVPFLSSEAIRNIVSTIGNGPAHTPKSIQAQYCIKAKK